MSKKSTKEKSTLLGQLGSLCDDHSSFQARVAIASFSETSSSSSVILDQVLMFFEHIQVISSILIITINLDLNLNSGLFKAALFLLRIISPDLWMSFDKYGVFTNTLMTLVNCFTMFKFLLFLYILYQCSRKTEASGLLVTFWRVLMKFQSRIAYMYISTYYINSIRVVDWAEFTASGDQNPAYNVAAFILIAIEFILAFVPKMFFHYMLPTKSFLSAKGNALEIATLLQKVVVQVLVAALDYTSPASNWVFAISNLCVDAFRVSYFYRVLPLYSFKALYMQGWFLMVVACLNLSFFTSVIVRTIDERYYSLSFSLILWAVLLVLAIFMSNNFLKMSFWRLVCDPYLDNPNLLVHRIVAIKELRKITQEHCEKNEKYDFHFLVNQTLNKHLEKILWAEGSGNDMDINTKESANIMFKNFLEKLSERFPHNKYVKIFLAEFHFKTMKVFRDPIKICLCLRKTRDINLRINAEILLVRIQNHIKIKNKTTPLNLFTFVSEHAFTAQLKQEMLKQANLQIEISSEIMEDAPNLELIYSKSQQAHSHRRNVIAKINQIANALSDWNMEALLVSAKYYLSLNHSIKDYLFLKKIYLQKLNRYQKVFSQDKLCPEDLFQDIAGFLFISGEKGEEGKILFATNSVGRILGGESHQYRGTDFVQKTPPIYRPIYSTVWKQMPEDSENSYIGNILRNYVYNINGHLVEIEYYIGIHPFASQGFGFLFLIRPVFSNKQCMLLHENGDIDSVTKGLLEKLNLRPHSVRTNIRTLNEELEMVNDAFNMMAFPHKYDTEAMKDFLSVEEAEEIYKKYTTEGVDIMLKSESGMSYSYNCKIHNVVVGSLLIKTVTLEENRRENRERTNELSPVFYQKESIHSSSNSNSNSLRTEEEKEEGWIDFDAMTAAKKTDLDIQQTPFSSQTEAEILTKTQRGEEPESATTTRRQLMTSRTTLKKLEYKSTAKLAAVHLSDSMNGDPDFEEEEGYHKVVPESSLRSKNSSRFGQQKRLATVYHASLDTKYYTKTFWALFSLFYVSLGLMIVLRIIVKFTIDADMKALGAKKDIFNNNSLRSYYLIENAGMTRLGYQIYLNQFDLSIYGHTYEDTYSRIRGLVLANIKELRETNKVVLEESNILDEEAHNALYAKNAKIYTTYFDDSVQDFTQMDTFQATDRIIESALSLYEAFSDVAYNSTYVDPEAVTRARFFFRNSLNDLILTNEQLSLKMLESYSQQFESVKSLSLAFTIIMVVFLCGFAGAFFIVLRRQYSEYVFYISAVCKLNHGKVQMIQQEFLYFQKKLKEEEGSGNLVEKAQKIRHAKTRDENSLRSVKRESLKVPESKEIRKRYLIYILGITLLLFGLAAFVVYDQVHSVEIFQKMDVNQERLDFTNKLRIRISLTTASFRELVATNNVAMVENAQVLDKFEGLIKELKSLRVDIYSTLLTGESLKESPEIQTLLLEDGCSMLQSSLYPFCDRLEANGMSGGFIYLLNEFEGHMTEKLEAYKASNKTDAALVELQVKDYDIISYIYVVALNEAEVLESIVNEKYEEKMKADTNRRMMSLVGILLMIFGVAIFGWIFVLKKLGESVSRFKNILRVLPAELVLSSFILKTLLMRSSKGILDQVKNEI